MAQSNCQGDGPDDVFATMPFNLGINCCMILVSPSHVTVIDYEARDSGREFPTLACSQGIHDHKTWLALR